MTRRRGDAETRGSVSVSTVSPRLRVNVWGKARTEKVRKFNRAEWLNLRRDSFPVLTSGLVDLVKNCGEVKGLMMLLPVFRWWVNTLFFE